METIEETLAQLQKPAQEKPTNGEKSIFGIFTLDELKNLQVEYKQHFNAEKSLREIATPLFRKYNVRSLSMLHPDTDLNDRVKEEAIKTAFYDIQSEVVTKTVEREVRKVVEHKKGDIMRDENGNPIQKSNGNFEEYTKNTKEFTYETEIKEVPLFDYKNSTRSLTDIKKFVESIEVPLDYEKLTKKMCANINFNRGLDIIRELTNYYVFEDNEKFVERFAMLICNAKAKGLNLHPKYPVMFSLVGEMGKGKGWLATMIKRTYDSNFETTSSKSSFKRLFGSQFNGVMMTRGFIHFDEKNGIDSTQCEELKTLITEPEVEVQMKYKEPMTVRNLVTFFSTTNESIKDVMGLQKDRRLVEFVLKEKTKEIPEDKMVELLNELWEVMPCEFPNPDKVVNELLDESSEVLAVNMSEIVYDLFTQHQNEFVKGKWVSLRQMKTTLQNMRGNRSQSVVCWCIKNDILAKYGNGNYYIVQENLDKLIDEQRNACSIGNEEVEDAEFTRLMEGL